MLSPQSGALGATRIEGPIRRRRSQLQQDLGIHAYSLRCALRGNRWLLLVPAFIALSVTLAQVLWRDELSQTLQVSTAEVMGSLLAGFFGANIMDAEFRLRAGEVIFTKPYAPWRLIMGRVLLCLFGVLALISVNVIALDLFRNLHHGGAALAAAIAPSLFLCSIGCILFVVSSNVILAYIGPTLFWVWSTLGAPLGYRFDRLYNPVYQISAWSDYLADPSTASLETLVANNIALVLTAILLFWWCCRRLRTAVIQ